MKVDPKNVPFAVKLLRNWPAKLWAVRLLDALSKHPIAPLPETYQCREIQIPRSDGSGSVRTLVISPKAQKEPLPVVVHLHGGGYLIGTPESSSLKPIANLLKATDAVFVVPDYRLAKDMPYPAAHDDCYDALVWAARNAHEIGGRPDQIILGGESAGGGLVLSTALRARDRGEVNVAFQFPICPMIDDDEANWTPVAPADQSWPPSLNRFGWDRLLGAGRRGGADVTAYEAPIRTKDWSGLPPTFTFVGECDLFHAQTSAMVEALRNAGVDVVFDTKPGVYHSMEFFSENQPVSQDILRFYRETFIEFTEKYFAPQPERPE